MIANGISIKITLSDETYQKYEAQAKKTGKSTERIIEERLWRYEDASSQKPIILDDDSRRAIEKVIGRNLTTPEEVVACLQRAMSVKIDGLKVQLPARVMERLQSRCIGMDFQAFLQMLVQRQLEEYTGLR